MRQQLDRLDYLKRCARHKHHFCENLPIYGIILVAVLCILDLVLTMIKIAQGPFVDANPIAQSIIQSGFYSGLILLKIYAVSIFVWVCTKNRHLLITKVGITTSAIVYILLTFHWTVVF